MKRSPLKRSTTPINRVSVKTFDKQSARCTLRQAYLEAHPFCECCGIARATEIHEPWTRGRGGPIDDARNFMSLDSHCHRFIHENPEWAESKGFLISAAGGPKWLERGGVNQ